MKVRFLRNMHYPLGTPHRAGDEIEMKDSDARDLIHKGRVEEVVGKRAKAAPQKGKKADPTKGPQTGGPDGEIKPLSSSRAAPAPKGKTTPPSRPRRRPTAAKS